jgi:CheY-like chemotaxis protein
MVSGSGYFRTASAGRHGRSRSWFKSILIEAQEMKNSTIAWLIDDDGLANFLTEKILKLSQFATQTSTFTTIEGALYFLNRAVEGGTVDFPDYIFLDINMPGLDGWHFLDSFAELPEELKGKCSLYMLSSSIDKGDRLRTEQHKDACGFISKPISEEDLENIKHQRISHK